MPCSQGALGQLAMKEGSGTIDFSTGASFFPFYRESIKKVGKIVHPDVIIGSREEVSERARKTPYFYGGWVVLNLTPGDAATLLPWALGADASGTTVSFALQIYFRNYLAPGSSESFPTASYAVTGAYAPLVFEDAVLTLASTSREVKSFTLDINNYVTPRWVNNLEATALCPSRRTINFNAVVPYDSGTSALYDAALAGVSGNLAITNGTVSTTFTFGTLQLDTETPEIRGKQELDLVLNGSIRKTGSTSSLVVTNDSTP
jgi:hypothetical protein